MASTSGIKRKDFSSAEEITMKRIKIAALEPVKGNMWKADAHTSEVAVFLLKYFTTEVILHQLRDVRDSWGRQKFVQHVNELEEFRLKKRFRVMSVDELKLIYTGLCGNYDGEEPATEYSITDRLRSDVKREYAASIGNWLDAVIFDFDPGFKQLLKDCEFYINKKVEAEFLGKCIEHFWIIIDERQMDVVHT